MSQYKKRKQKYFETYIKMSIFNCKNLINENLALTILKYN